MNRVIRVFCFFVISVFSWALADNRIMHDKIAVVVNRHVVTQGDVDRYVYIYAQLSDNQKHVNDPEFRSYITSLMVVQYMLEDYAERVELSLTHDEEVRTLTMFMEDQGKTYAEFQEYSEMLGIDPERMKRVICAGTLQQKIGMAVIAPNLEVTEDEMVRERHQFIDEHALYKMKSWTIGFESRETVDSVKLIKRQWAETGDSPKIGEVHDLGWKKRSELPELFLKAIEGVAPGNLVGPVQSMFGYHLIWFEGEKVPDMPTDEQIKNNILNRKYAAKFAEWVKDLQQYNIVIYK